MKCDVNSYIRHTVILMAVSLCESVWICFGSLKPFLLPSHILCPTIIHLMQKTCISRLDATGLDFQSVTIMPLLILPSTNFQKIKCLEFINQAALQKIHI